MDKRNKLWRRQQMSRVFKARMILYAAYDGQKKQTLETPTNGACV